MPEQQLPPAYYADDTITLHHGDCLDVLRGLPDNSVDSVVTDPPYGLGFMGKEWDKPGQATRPTTTSVQLTSNPYSAGRAEYGGASYGGGYLTSIRAFGDWCEAWSAECLRVLKPGGHLLAFGGTRTWHRLAVAVEDAGFEVRDSMAWLYGSGFPKSLDVSKAIDKRRVEDLEPVRAICRAVRAAMDVRDLKSRDLVEHFDGCHPRLIDHWAARDTDSQPSLPTVDQWEVLAGLLAELREHDSEVYRLNGRKGAPGQAWEERPITGEVAEWSDRVNYALTSRDGLRRDVAATPDAERWQGWGTALKPAFEPIVVARKPLVGTVAANVLAHGTGALNIDGCRVEGEPWKAHEATGLGSVKFFTEGDTPVIHKKPHTGGRWPANVVLDESQAAALDEQSGQLTSGKMRAGTRPQGDRETYGRDAASGYETQADTPGDTGGASRFFYVAKADASERVRINGHAHPTVKPLSLIRWLVRLVTPPGGTVLEPFTGSGTTVEACILEGMRCIAIEREADYLPLTVQRVQRRTDPVAAVRAAAGADGDLGLFGLLEGELP